jgi:hypothetical protein
MNKRNFVVTAGLAGVFSATSGMAASRTARQPALLTVSGAIDKPNRGPFDAVRDQMMGKHGVQFSKAHELDAAALQRLPAVSIRPTLEYDAQRHTLEGPLLASVLDAAGVAPGRAVTLGLRAVDGYNAVLSLADALAYRMIVATHMDGRPLALGGLGPQWAVYDADALPAFRDKPLKERFAACPWGLYHIDVQSA